MATSINQLSEDDVSRHKKSGARCKIIEDEISNIAEFFAVFESVLKADTPYWYRGHSNLEYELVPSALRHRTVAKRNAAISLLADFRRLAEIKLEKPPQINENLRWLQIAQHYGLGTRLLDWTENAAVALYFACQTSRSAKSIDGSVYILNPVDLNRRIDSKNPRVFDAQDDSDIITPYLRLTGRLARNGRRTIAIHPVWNSERIAMQKGVFTLHGSRDSSFDRKQASSLVKIPILCGSKSKLLTELDRVGISEQSIFPELEHLCNHLKGKSNLT